MDWKLMILVAAIAVGAIGAIMLGIQQSTNDFHREYMQVASDGSYGDGVLVLNGVVTLSAYRHLDETQTLSPQELLDRWMNGGEEPKPVPAELELADGETLAIDLLGPPAIFGNQLTYPIEILDGSIPERFEFATLIFKLED